MKDFRTIWKTLAAEKALSSHFFIQRAILIAMGSKRNMPKRNMPKEDIITILIHKYYTPITNENKLDNGCKKFDAVSMDMRTTRNKFVSILGVMPAEFFDNKDDEKLYYELANSIQVDRIDRKYIYYFTIQDILTPEQQGVQAGHALFALGARLGEKADPANTYFQWIGARDSSDLYSIAKKYEHLKPEKFYEPDVGHKMTSIALPPVPWYKRGDLVDYPLLTHAR
jgi:hypothetical protein